MLDASTAIRVATSLGSIGYSDLKARLAGVIAGDVYWVDSNGTGAGATASVPGTFEQPFSTLTYAISRTTASKGDVIFVKPGHAETTTAIAWSKAGIRVVGLGLGRNKPTFTASTASTDLINVTAANGRLENVRLVGAASGCTALLDIAGTDFVAENVRFEHGAAPLTAVTIPGAAGTRFKLIDCEWIGTAAGPDNSIYIENGATTGAVSDWQVIRPRAYYGGSSGLDEAFLRADRRGTGYIIENPIVVGIDALFIDINSSVAALGDGLLVGARVAASGALTIANVNDVGGCMPLDNQYTDSLTASGARIPATTAS